MNRLLIALALIILPASLALGAGTRPTWAAINAVGSLTGSNIGLSCSSSEEVLLTCRATFTAPPGTAFLAGTTASGSISQGSALIADGFCQFPNNPASPTSCGLSLVSIPSGFTPLTYAVFISSGGVTQSFCGVVGQFPTNPCRST